MLCVSVSSGRRLSSYVDKYERISLRWGYGCDNVAHPGLHHTTTPQSHALICLANMPRAPPVRPFINSLAAARITGRHHCFRPGVRCIRRGFPGLYKAANICLWKAYQGAQTLCTCLMNAERKFEVAVSLNHDAMTSFRVNK